MPLSQANTTNSLLKAMLPADYALLAPHLMRMALPRGLQLHAAGSRIDKVYFPEDGIVSIVAVTLDGKQSEVGVFGREGMSETATVLGTDHSPHEAFVQSAGVSALRLNVKALMAAFGDSVTLRDHLLRYVQTMMVQLSSSIAAAGQTIPQRLARWLLMCHDRVDGDDLGLTHDFIGMMLGVRRAGVTVALHELEDAGFVETSRGNVAVRDRDGLEKLAAGGYGLAESEYFRLIGIPLSRSANDVLNPRPLPAAA